MRRMEHIGDALREFLKAARLDQRIADYQPVLAWERIVGPEVAAHASVLRLQRGILWVAVSGSAWIQHIGYLKPRILEAMRREFPGARITDLRCVLGGRQQP